MENSNEEFFKQPIATAERGKKKNKFRWSIDQMAVLRPMQFDESELSLPPHDWDPDAEQNRTQPSVIDQFWSKNAQIVPSPDVAPASSKRARRQNDHAHPQARSSPDEISNSSPNKQNNQVQSIVFCSPSFPGLIGSNNSHPSSSVATPSSTNFSSLQVSPSSPTYESTRRILEFNIDDKKEMSPIIDENKEEFEQIEQSLSFGIDANEILADLGEDGGGFVRRHSNENEKIVTGFVGGEKVENSSEGSSGLGTSSGSVGGNSWITMGMAPSFTIDASPIKPTYEE